MGSKDSNEIILNGTVIGKVFMQIDGSYEAWIPHGLVMDALEIATGKLIFTH